MSIAARTNRTTRTIATGLAVVAASATLGIAGAGVASAQQYGSYSLAPGFGQCTPVQWASFQVRADGWATADGAKFKLVRNGAVVANTETRVQYWGAERRSAYGNFPGAGYYALCAQNTGTKNTVATLQLRTDSEF